MSVLDVAAAMIEVLTGGDVEAIPISFNHLVGSEVVMVPCGEDKLGAGSAESLEKFMLVLFCPTVVVVDVAAKVGRVAVDDVARLGSLDGFDKGYIIEFPLLVLDDARYVFYLIAYLGDVGRCETVGLLAERDVPVAVTVEAHHAIEACTRKEDEVVGAVLLVEAVADKTEMGISFIVGLGQQAALVFEIGAHGILRDFTILHGAVEVDDVRIGVAYDVGTAHGRVEANDARAEEWLYPAGVEIGARGQNEVVNPWHKLCLDALRLDGGNSDDCHTLLIEFFADFLLLVKVSLVCLKVVVAWLANACLLSVGGIEEVHPIVIENVLAEVSKSSATRH